MISKTTRFLLAIMLGVWCCLSISTALAGSYNANYGKRLSKEEKEVLCAFIAQQSEELAGKEKSALGGVIPDSVLTSIYNTTYNISNSVMLVSVLGNALMCHATHSGKEHVTVFGVEIVSFPNIPVWICGAIVYCFGFMLVLSIAFYVVDVSFKLGFAIILLPIGIALWPFEKTKDKIVILISIFLRTAAIFVFLAITVSYTVEMLSVALGNIHSSLDAIDKNDTDTISQTFSLGSSVYLVVVAVLVYGMKLIGSAIPEYANKFFPDKAFGGASPIHHLSTQAVDFAKQKVVQPVARYAGDVASTQAGKLTEKAGVAVGKKMKITGKVIERVGQVMQDHRPKK